MTMPLTHESVTQRHFVPSPALSDEAVAHWQAYLKRANPVYMVQIAEVPFTVETNEGTMTAHPGDYVAHDPISGHFWPIAASYVEQHYDRFP